MVGRWDAGYLCCLTKSGHAYIQLIATLPLERVSAIVEVAEPSLIIAINEFPLENPVVPIMSLSKCMKLMYPACPWPATSGQRDDNHYIIFTSGTTGNQRCKFRTTTCSALTTMIMIRNCNARVRKCWHNHHILLTCLSCTGHRPGSEEPFTFRQPSPRLQTTFAQSFLSDCNLDFNTIFCRYGHVIWRFQCWKDARNSISTLMGKSWPLKTAQKLRELFPKCTHHQCPSAWF